MTGASFLVHDLGMSKAAYSGGMSEIKEHDTWRDILYSFMQAELGRAPNTDELNNPSHSVEARTISLFLRENHGNKARQICVDPVPNQDGTNEFLIEDGDLRRAFGEVIGKIAQSHWWSVSKLENELAGAPTGSASGLCCPPEWTVDRLKIACLMRIADAAHLDARRAPHFLRALRRPGHDSAAHWKFQGMLAFPQLSRDQLVFTSLESFSRSDADAWWQCWDALNVLDRELHDVYSLLADSNRRPPAARGVAGTGNPTRLAQYVRTVGWKPVDIKVDVRNVAELIARIGGKELYGPNYWVPLRELIQNSADAIRARRLVDNYGIDEGCIIIRVGSDGDEQKWIEIEDNGIGMSMEVLSGALLDFGGSLWSSSLAQSEWPGLLSKGYQAFGKYGLGFFSVFMLGNRVSVASCKLGEARADTLILDFPKGLNERPLLRGPSNTSEVIQNGGTRIRVYLQEGRQIGDIISSARDKGFHPSDLSRFCARLCAALDVDVQLEEERKPPVRIVTANDWVTMDPGRLLARLWSPAMDSQRRNVKMFGEHLQMLYNETGQPLARAAIAPTDYVSRLSRNPIYAGIITVGGLFAEFTHQFAGVMTGFSARASRDSAVINEIPKVAWERWASKQATLVTRLGVLDVHGRTAHTLWQLGANVGGLPIARSAEGWLSYADIAEGNWPETMIVAQLGRNCAKPFSTAAAFDRNVLFAEFSGTGIPAGIPIGNRRFPSMTGKWAGRVRSCESMVLAALAEAWGVSVESLLEGVKEEWHVPIGKMGTTQLTERALVVRRRE